MLPIRKYHAKPYSFAIGSLSESDMLESFDRLKGYNRKLEKVQRCVIYAGPSNFTYLAGFVAGLKVIPNGITFILETEKPFPTDLVLDTQSWGLLGYKAAE